MNKKGASDSNHVMLIAIVGLVAVIGLVLGLRGGSVTGNPVVVTGIDTATGQPVAVSAGGFAGGVPELTERIGDLEAFHKPDAVTVITPETANTFVMDGMRPIWNPDGWGYIHVHLDGSVHLRDANPADGVTLTFSTSETGPFVSDLVVPQIDVDAHPIHIHEVHTATGNVLIHKLYYLFAPDSSSVFWFEAGFVNANGDVPPPRPDFINQGIAS